MKGLGDDYEKKTSVKAKSVKKAIAQKTIVEKETQKYYISATCPWFITTFNTRYSFNDV